METISTSMTQVLTLAGTVLDTVLANPVLALFFCCGIVGTVIGVVHKLKRV